MILFQENIYKFFLVTIYIYICIDKLTKVEVINLILPLKYVKLNWYDQMKDVELNTLQRKTHIDKANLIFSLCVNF